MSTIHTRTAPSRRVPPAAPQLGPVTLAIRALRPNPILSRDALDAQHEDERRALRELRERIAGRIEADLALLDALDGDCDLEDGADHEPSLCTAEGTGPWPLTGSTYAGDDREHDAIEDGLGDWDGLAEQGHAIRHEVFA